jgi:acyl-CoA thioester hydrolase
MQLNTSVEIPVRFSEVDSLFIVWHGHYVRYFEDAREAFGQEHGLTYMDVFNAGYATPIVSVHCDYKSPLAYGDIAQATATYVHSEAAKIIFDYTITNKTTGAVVATGRTIQAFISADTRLLELITPDFFIEWKYKTGILKK